MMDDKILILANAYNQAKTHQEAKDYRTELFTELVHRFGAPHFSVVFSNTDFVSEGLAKITTINAQEDGQDIQYVWRDNDDSN